MMQPCKFAAVVTICALSLLNKTTALNLLMEIDEESNKGTVIADLASIFGLSWEEKAGREFELFNQQKIQLTRSVVTLEKNLVEVDPNSGLITLSRKLDRDDLCKQDTTCTLKIQAIMRPTRFFQLLKLDIKIRDINDNTPLFPNNNIAINVSENTKVDDVIDLNAHQASDIDSGNNSIIEYKLSNNQYFKVHQYTDETGSSQLKLILLKELDFEGQAKHQFQLIATDKGEPPKSSHVILHVTVLDENDNRPVFTPKNYVVTVEENFSPGAEIITVKASDLDQGANGHVTYSLASDVPSMQSALVRDLLSVDTTTGVVSLMRRLSYNNHNGLEFQIEATDHGVPSLSSRARLTLNILDVNDHSPVIKFKYVDGSAYLLESSPESTYVAYVRVTDADSSNNGEVEVSIRTLESKKAGVNSDSGHFVLAPDGLMQTAKPFDCEVENRYHIIISACDKGDPPRCSQSNITIEILDVNDNAPVFNPDVYEITLSENDDVGTEVITIIASDDDVMNAPVMMKNQEGQVIPSTNGQIKYSIKNNDIFSIDPDTGRVVLARQLDYEGNSKWEIIVVATDLGFPPLIGTCVLKVNVRDFNDNPPIFTTPHVDNSTVYASILLDQPIIQLQAVDYDSFAYSDLTMDLMEIDGIKADDAFQAHEQPWFAIFLLDRQTGELTLNLSYEKLDKIIGEHYLVIQSSDNGVPSLKSKTGLFVRVTDDIVLPLVANNDNIERDTSSQNDFPPFFLIIIIASACLLLIIIVVLVAFVKCKRSNKMDHSYSCREAENKSGYSRKSSTLSSKQDYVSNSNLKSNGHVIASRHQSMEARTKSLSLSSSNQTSVNKDPLSPTSVAEPGSNPEIYQLLPNQGTACDSTTKIITSSPASPAAQHRQYLLGKDVTCFGGRVTSSQADKDSGRGDSEVDASCWPIGQERRTLSNHDAAIEGNDFGRFCTHDCSRYGHSDSCWMPESDVTQIPTIHHSHSGPGLEPIRENPSLCLKPVAGLPCVPVAARDRLRKSLCLALMGGEGHHQHHFRSEPSYPHLPSEDLSRLRQLWKNEVAKDDTPYSSVFGSSSPSPAPSDGRCNSLSCDKDKTLAAPECEELLRREHYMSLVSNHDTRYSASKPHIGNKGCL